MLVRGILFFLLVWVAVLLVTERGKLPSFKTALKAFICTAITAVIVISFVLVF